MPVSRLLKTHLRQVLKLEEAATRRLLATYRAAELELAGRLAQLDAEGKDSTFTAQHLALIRAQVDSALRVFWQAGGRDLRAAYEQAIATGSTQALAEIVDLERRLGPVERPLTSLPLADRIEATMPVVPAQQVAFLADDQNLLLSRFRDGAFQAVSRELSLSTLMGESTSQAARRVGTVMAGQRYQLERIARTEINHAANVGHMNTVQTVADEFPEMGLKKQWSAHLDSRTSGRCRGLHLQVRQVGEEFVARDGWRGQFPVAHPNCRSRVMPYSERWEARSVKKIAEQSPSTSGNPEQDSRPTPGARKAAEKSNEKRGFTPAPDLTRAEAAQARAAAANFASRQVKPDRRVIGREYQGRTIGQRENSLTAHAAKRVLAEEQWAPGTTPQQYLADLRAAAAHPQARVVQYERDGQQFIGILAPNTVPDERRGESPEAHVYVVYSETHGTILSGYMASGPEALKIGENPRWIK